jgi:small subunit ribosomal protein S19
MARSAKKGPYVQPSLLAKAQKIKSSGKREVIKTWSRRSMVIPEFVGLTIAVHNGKKFVSVFVTENMVGHYLGEFAPTRTFRAHSGQRQAGAVPAAEPVAAPAPAAPAK